ncbi:Nose resistant to fluoxetine protein 6 like protein [Argiope bruennichi]|uniref:Nose resistant to fluoxetine protein 6 like protein n=1 Tax=Argiope bruennichi TaxID=94029 RepID=A0A8T0E315_ARGBR|nr:Nose resistant to fluoxetine protein 6 like protein [Argiope bruennichi]
MDNQADTCREEAWQATLPTFLLNLGDRWPEAGNISITQSQQEPKKLTTEGFYVLCLIVLFVIPSLIGSAINAFESFCGASPKKKISTNGKDQRNDANGETNVTTTKEEDESPAISDWRENCRKFFDCFCIQTNARKILRISSSPGYLDCIDGIRAILFLWIYLTHFFTFYGASIKNISQFIPHFNNMTIVKFAGHAVFVLDTFIILSGFLTGYSFSDYYEKNNGKVPWILFYAVRFLRVMPLYIVLLGFYSTLFTYISSSPIWPTYNTNPVCRENWIWNILFINNFLSHYNQCMGMTWFLACVMQLHVISPLFLLPLKRWPKVGYALSVVAIFCSCVATYIVTLKYNLFNILPKTLPENNSAEVLEGMLWKNIDELNQKTYIRLIPYLVGLILGVYLQGRNPSKKNSLPISRLSFCAYLTQTMLFEGYFLSVEVPVGESFVREGFFGVTWFPVFGRLFLWTFALAFVVSVLFLPL